MKALYIQSDDNPDFGKLDFEQNFKGDWVELWQKVWDKENHQMEYELETVDDGEVWYTEYNLEADDLDDKTFYATKEEDEDILKSHGWIPIVNGKPDLDFPEDEE